MDSDGFTTGGDAYPDGPAADDSFQIRSVAVLGLGLIGGSVARDLATRGVRVLAWDRDEHAVRDAEVRGIARPLAWNDPHPADPPIDVVLLALPVLAEKELLPRVADRFPRARLITDAGSTQRSVVALAERLGIGARFVGSHPLAGDHRSGWAASRTGLFAHARVFLSPAPSAGPDAMGLAEALWTALGGRTEPVDAAEHDRRVAWTSHLPQLVSSALGGSLAGEGIARAELGPGGRDTTRLAGSSPALWTDVALDNADEIVPALRAAEDRLRALRLAIAAGGAERVRGLLDEARRWHHQAP
jgi:prephenate dehydrogenase